MQLKEFTIALENISKSLDNIFPDVVSAQVVIEVIAEHKDRIFYKGIKSDGNEIGNYSQKSSYYNKDKFIRKTAFVPRGKNNKGKFKNGNKRKTMYIKEGYSGFRDIQGRESKKKNYKYSGSLERSLNIVNFAGYIIYGCTSELESKKIKVLENQTPNTFQLSENEKELMQKKIDQLIGDILNG